MKTFDGVIENVWEKDRDTVSSSDMQGGFDGGFTTLPMARLTDSVEGKDMVYDVMLKELVKYRKELQEEKKVRVYVEWDITDDFKRYIACRVKKVEVV